MRRRLFIVGGALTLAPSLAHAEQERRIGDGVLEAWAPSAFPHRLQAFREGLRELGHLEGRTFVIIPLRSWRREGAAGARR